MTDRGVLVFGGTTEGRELCEYLYAQNIPFTACVATDYGEACLAHMPGADIRTGRLNLEEIAALAPAYRLVTDATHPYAQEVSRNIRSACEAAGVPCLRVLRPSLGGEDCRYFADIPAVCGFLAQTQGRVLVTTGSKELGPYTLLPDFRERLFVRVLPSVESIGECLSLGIPSSHIIAMQGPFSKDLNCALLGQTGARFLVTKESGAGGGYCEKLEAAKSLGVIPLVVGRPQGESGLSLAQAIGEIEKQLGQPQGYFPLFFNLQKKPVTVIGGGKIALRRVKALLPFGPRITVIAPHIEPELESLGEITLLRRSYQAGDEKGAFLVLAATGDPAVNGQVHKNCRGAGIPVNRCDSRENCDFYFPALFQNESLIGGLVSKKGDSHRLVKETANRLRAFIKER